MMLGIKYQFPLYPTQAQLLMPRGSGNTDFAHRYLPHHRTINSRHIMHPATQSIVVQAIAPQHSLHMPVSLATTAMRRYLKRSREYDEDAARKARDAISHKRRRVEDMMDTSDDDAEDNTQ
ncbi:hypothetical protein DFQ27_001855, partial [Actinomortierella ambigua]